MMKAWQHFKTITTHKMWVMRYCFKIGLYWQGLTHDLSKYSPSEFWQGCKYYQGYRSPNNAEREDKGYSAAWLHHKGRNKHHLEYWLDYSPINLLPRHEALPLDEHAVRRRVFHRVPSRLDQSIPIRRAFSASSICRAEIWFSILCRAEYFSW